MKDTQVFYEGHPSILKIKENIVLDKKLSRNMKDTQVFFKDKREYCTRQKVIKKYEGHQVF